MCVLKGFTDILFDPPSRTSPPQSKSSSASGSTLLATTSLPGYPETTFLDSARLVSYSADAADSTAMYMFLMLYRQLVFYDATQSSSRPMPKVTDSDISQLKTEIRDIASCRLGYCFTRILPEEQTGLPGQSSKKCSDKDWEKWQKCAQDIVLQISMRATQAQARAKGTLPTDGSVSLQSPDPRMLQLAERWLETNLCYRSPLSTILRNRLRDAVFHRLVATTFPARDVATGKLSAAVDLGSTVLASMSSSPPPCGPVTGMESLTEEIAALADKLSKFSLIHLGVYLPLYEQEDFIQT